MSKKEYYIASPIAGSPPVASLRPSPSNPRLDHKVKAMERRLNRAHKKTKKLQNKRNYR